MICEHFARFRQARWPVDGNVESARPVPEEEQHPRSLQKRKPSKMQEHAPKDIIESTSPLPRSREDPSADSPDFTGLSGNHHPDAYAIQKARST
jgi:hypothetical protein